jgi:tRNA-Thr(GGU) m(6)t(6)A37 methyltransferase TsaA
MDRFDTLALEPIGVVRCDLQNKVEAARQPRAADGAAGRIELLPGRNFEHALEDLEGWEFLWVIFWFHHNEGWRPKVLPPRSRSGRKGVFATRAPHRPNPLGLSVVRLVGIDGLTIHVSNIDMLDGTPVLDLKPYVAYTDSIPDARSGWLDDATLVTGAASGGASAPDDPQSVWSVAFEPLAAQQSAWIETRTALPIAARIGQTLALGPEPHPYRRIRRDGAALLLAVKEWRVQCVVEGRAIRVLAISSGYRAAQLADAELGAEPFLAHREYLAAFAPQR